MTIKETLLLDLILRLMKVPLKCKKWMQHLLGTIIKSVLKSTELQNLTKLLWL
jgi:hypothetical protein